MASGICVTLVGLTISRRGNVGDKVPARMSEDIESCRALSTVALVGRPARWSHSAR